MLLSILALCLTIVILLIGIVFFIQLLFAHVEISIRREIQNSVVPKFLEVSVEIKALTDLGTAFWRLEQKLNSLNLLNSTEDEKKVIDSSMSRMHRYLEIHDIEVQDYTNKSFNEGLNVDVISVVKEEGVSSPVIKETIEPTILSKGQLIRKAKVIVLEGSN